MHSDDLHFMRRLMDHVPSMLAYWDRDLHCRFANQAYKTWFNVAPGAMKGMHMREVLGPSLFALTEPYLQKALLGEAQIFERRLPESHGQPRECIAEYLPDLVDGEVRGLFTHVLEITERKRFEHALRASEAFLERTSRIARVGGWEIDLRSGRHSCSGQLCELLGADPGQPFTQDDMLALVAPDHRHRLEAAFDACQRHGAAWDIELPIQTRHGQQLWVRHIGEAVLEAGQAVRLVGALQDITEQVAHRAELAREQSLRTQMEQHAMDLNALLAERGDMLDVLAHEVRQPLHNASAALQSAQAALAHVDDQVAMLRVARAQSVMQQVMASLDNTLAAATLLAHAVPIDMEDTDIDTMVAVAVADMAVADRSRVVVQRVTRTRTAAMDMSLMRLALRNLLSNALKYSAPGSPVVLKFYDSDEPLGLMIDVENGGPGIAPNVLPTLFQRVSRGPHHGAPVGLGLGLYIVKRVMEMHGGRVELARNVPTSVVMRLLLPPSAA